MYQQPKVSRYHNPNTSHHYSQTQIKTAIWVWAPGKQINQFNTQSCCR